MNRQERKKQFNPDNYEQEKERIRNINHREGIFFDKLLKNTKNISEREIIELCRVVYYQSKLKANNRQLIFDNMEDIVGDTYILIYENGFGKDLDNLRDVCVNHILKKYDVMSSISISSLNELIETVNDFDDETINPFENLDLVEKTVACITIIDIEES